MEDRYEIRGKIGQGGLGSVYRAYDRKMSREVAIKRITTGGEEGLAEESTRQLLKEAGALASLQHPHIVTVHDFGSDEDGPYVVMELISGKTLDDIIAHAPLTWLDFRELALQTQEALIAAQDLDLVHSDLKPSNLMLTWLPSGKFQVKVVDFGLAVLTQSQCRKEIEAMDEVFGSIFFMPPEQFERQPLNSRSDIYSIGCVYYQALTGQYPFNGRTANEVMESHLHHSVLPLHELREDIPQWVCDWVMWHINRYPQDRPESAREALALFLQNDRIPNPPMSRGQSPAEEPKRPKLIIPTSSPAETADASSPYESEPPPQTAYPTTAVAATQAAIDTGTRQETPIARPKLVIPGAPDPATVPTAPQYAPSPAYEPAPQPIAVQPIPQVAPAPVAEALPPAPTQIQAPSEPAIFHPATPAPAPMPSPVEAPPPAINTAPSPLTAATFLPTATPLPAQPGTPHPHATTPTPAPAPVPAPAAPAPAPAPLPSPASAATPIPLPTSTPSAPSPVPVPVATSSPPASPVPIPVPAPPPPSPAAQTATTQYPAIPPQVASAVAAAAAAAAETPAPALQTPAPGFPNPASMPVAADGSEPPNPLTSKTRSFARPKLVLNKHSTDDLQKSAAYSLATGTGLQPTIPASTTPHSVPPIPITTPHSIPRAPLAPATTPAAAPAMPTTPTASSPAQSTQPVSPQPLQPPAGSKPSIHTTQATQETAPVSTSDATPKPAPKTQAMAAPIPKTSRVVAVAPTKVSNSSAASATATAAIATVPKRKRGISNATKGMIATMLTISILIVSWVLVDRMGSNRDAETLNKLITKAAQPNTTEIPVNEKELNILLGSAANVSFNKHRSSIYKTLLLAKSSDGTDIDGTIAMFVTSREMLADVKEVLIRDVLRMRNNPSVVPTLITFASSTTDAKAATASLKAIRFMAEDRHFDPLLKIIQDNSNAEVRRAAEETMGEIIRKSGNKDRLADTLALQYSTALNQEIRHCLLRLMGVSGGEKALSTVREILRGNDSQQIIAAIIALGSWGDPTGFPVLIDFLKESRDANMRARAFDAAQKYLGQLADNLNEEQQWNMLSGQAKTREEQMKILQGIANLEGEWPLKLVQSFMKSDDDQVAQKAERALDYMKDRRKLNQESQE